MCFLYVNLMYNAIHLYPCIGNKFGYHDVFGNKFGPQGYQTAAVPSPLVSWISPYFQIS